jgi:hypothetical protein
MRNSVAKFWRDERGTLLLTEWVFLTTILVIAVVPFVFNLRDQSSDLQIKTVNVDRPAAASMTGDR